MFSDSNKNITKCMTLVGGMTTSICMRFHIGLHVCCEQKIYLMSPFSISWLNCGVYIVPICILLDPSIFALHQGNNNMFIYLKCAPQSSKIWLFLSWIKNKIVPACKGSLGTLHLWTLTFIVLFEKSNVW